MNKLVAAAAAAGISFNSAHCAPLPEARADDVGVSSQRLARLDEFFAREIATKRVPGTVVAIARDGKLIHYKAYGQLDPEKGTSMRLDAIFALASMTKPMVAVAGLTLTEQGRLPLRAKLTDYYPEFAKMKVGVPQPDASLKYEAQSSPIYVHDLYRHTSGLTYGAPPDSADQVASIRISQLRRSRAISGLSSKPLPSCRWRTNRARSSNTASRLTCLELSWSR